MTATELSELLTLEEAAAYLRLAPQTLRNWRTQGGGPRAIKTQKGRPGRILYRRSELDRWLDERTQDRTPSPDGPR